MAAYHNKYLLGFHSDGQGNWEATDNSPFDAAEQQFVMSHGSDGLLGTTQTRMVFSSKLAVALPHSLSLVVAC